MFMDIFFYPFSMTLHGDRQPKTQLPAVQVHGTKSVHFKWWEKASVYRVLYQKVQFNPNHSKEATQIKMFLHYTHPVSGDPRGPALILLCGHIIPCRSIQVGSVDEAQLGIGPVQFLLLQVNSETIWPENVFINNHLSGRTNTNSQESQTRVFLCWGSIWRGSNPIPLCFLVSYALVCWSLCSGFLLRSYRHYLSQWRTPGS